MQKQQHGANGLTAEQVKRIRWNDAFHIATAAVYGMDILLTWNCKHMANLITLPKTASVIAANGYECPKILTPKDALEVEYD